MPDPFPIVPLAPAQLRPASRLYARAFFADPLMMHYLPDPNLRETALPTFMHLALRYCLARGEVWAASDAKSSPGSQGTPGSQGSPATQGLAGVACWLPPGRTALSNWGLFRSSLGVVSISQAWRILRSFAQNGARGSFLGQVSAIENKIDLIHRATLPGPHWYLMILAVDPARQGQGLGSRLIAPQLARARAAGLPCYLETMLERDVAFYRKNGFMVAYDTDLLPTGPHLWAMTFNLVSK